MNDVEALVALVAVAAVLVPFADVPRSPIRSCSSSAGWRWDSCREARS